ncbi:MAG TPA: D-glycerate dehydrogenase [Chloroflexota bacterium]|nr:D-glycerate dehydrogenase [Chloroflexota bacterium]
MNAPPYVVVPQYLHEPGLGMVRDVARVEYWPEESVMPREKLLAAVATADGILCHPPARCNRELLDRAPRLRVISNVAVGYDNVDVPACTERGIIVCNTPGVLTDATADATLALMLAVCRRAIDNDRFTRSGNWHYWTPRLLLGQDLTEATVGIVGMGRIGLEVARRVRAFRTRILYHNRHRRPEVEAELGAIYVDLPTLLAESDFVCLHVPANAETRHLISAAELAQMKPTAYLINVARGAVVDQKALAEALKAGRIAGAGLDVYDPEPIAADDPLLSLENCVLFPHVASATLRCRQRMSELAARNLLAALAGETPPACVNPEVLKN